MALAALKQAPQQAVAAIEALRVGAVEMTHQPRQVGTAGVQHQVKVVAHQAVSQQLSIKAGHGLSDDGEAHVLVIVAAVNGLAALAAGGDVVGR